MTTLQTYNGLDCIATFQMWDVLEEKLKDNPWAEETYETTMALMAPSMYAMCRGVLVDLDMVQELKTKFDYECRELEKRLDACTRLMMNSSVNLASPVHVKWLFDCLDAETDSSDREAIETIEKVHPDLRPITQIVLQWRDKAKMAGDLKPEIFDRDGRIRTGYKIAGTETTRWSSGKNAHWTGLNMQNRKRDEDEEKVGHASIREMFIADPGKKFINIDLERADSWMVALEVFKATGSRKYLNACSARDLHTYVSKLVWPNLGWTGDEDHDIKLAKQFFYRQYDYRFMSKKLQHGGNYLGSAWGISTQMKIPREKADAGLRAYFREFPDIPKWHKLKAKELQTTGHLTTLFGTRRNFHGRLDSDSTLREAIAFLGQGGTAGSINRSVLNLWDLQFASPELGLEFLAQVHDSALEQCYESRERAAVDAIREKMPVPITVTSPQGETITVAVPLEVSVGWNWAAESASNPDGLRKLKPGTYDDRKRTKIPNEKKLGFMDRRLSGLHRGA